MDAHDDPTVPGFRIVRRLAPGLWDALDLVLERRVALRRVEGFFDGARWPERPDVAQLYSMVDGTGGPFVVSQIPRDASTFAARVATGASRREQLAWLKRAASAVAGAAHGSLTANCILVGSDDEMMLLGFGEALDPTPADDRRALKRLRPKHSLPARRASASPAPALRVDVLQPLGG